MSCLAVAAAAVAALAACQGSPSSSPTNSPPAPLAAADAKLFAGDYEAAESAYQDLIKQGAKDAGAHYALLLDYEARYRDAVTQAQAAATARAASTAVSQPVVTAANGDSTHVAAASCATSTR